MPDITMCQNVDCKLKDHCFRFYAIPNPEWQAYTRYEPNEDGKSCEYIIWSIRKTYNHNHDNNKETEK